MAVPLITEALSPGSGSTLGFFTRAAAELPFHEVSLLALAHLETSGFTNHQQLMLLKEICPRGNNKLLLISLYHDKCLLFMLELY